MHRADSLFPKLLGVFFICFGLPLPAASPVFSSHGRIELVKTGDQSPALDPDYLGTQLEFLEMGRLNNLALMRVRSVRPELTTDEVEITIHVQREKDQPVLLVTATGSKAKYTQAFLEAFLEQFIRIHPNFIHPAAYSAARLLTEEVLTAEKRLKQWDAQLKRAEEPEKPAESIPDKPSALRPKLKLTEEPRKPAELARALTLKRALAQETLEALKKKMIELNELSKSPMDDMVIKEHATPAELSTL